MFIFQRNKHSFIWFGLLCVQGIEPPTEVLAPKVHLTSSTPLCVRIFVCCNSNVPVRKTQLRSAVQRSCKSWSVASLKLCVALLMCHTTSMSVRKHSMKSNKSCWHLFVFFLSLVALYVGAPPLEVDTPAKAATRFLQRLWNNSLQWLYSQMTLYHRKKEGSDAILLGLRCVTQPHRLHFFNSLFMWLCPLWGKHPASSAPAAA